jgi:hypothetical protein
MKRSLPARVLVLAMLAAVGLGAHASISGADEPQLYGTVDAIDPLVGYDWAPPITDPYVDEAAANGATVTTETCTLGDRPNADNPIFRRPVQTTGHLVITPSGSVTFICHAAADRGSIRAPGEAVVVDPIPCFLPSGRRTTDARLVVTPSLHVHLVCHLLPPS